MLRSVNIGHSVKPKTTSNPTAQAIHGWVSFITDTTKLTFLPALIIGWVLIKAYSFRVGVAVATPDNVPLFLACSLGFICIVVFVLFGACLPSLHHIYGISPEEALFLEYKRSCTSYYVKRYFILYAPAVFSTLGFVLLVSLAYEWNPHATVDAKIFKGLTVSDLALIGFVLGEIIGLAISKVLYNRYGSPDKRRSGWTQLASSFSISYAMSLWLFAALWIALTVLTNNFNVPENRWSIPALLIGIALAVLMSHALQVVLAEKYSRDFLRIGFGLMALASFIALCLWPGAATVGAVALYALDVGGGIPVTATMREYPVGSAKLRAGTQVTIQEISRNDYVSPPKCERLPAPSSSIATINREDIVKLAFHRPSPMERTDQGR